MIFDIFIYIMGTLIALCGFHLSYKKRTVYYWMSQKEILVIIANWIIGSVYIGIGLIIITITAKG